MTKSKKKSNIITLIKKEGMRIELEVRASIGKLFWIEWGDGQETNHSGQAERMKLTHRYSSGIGLKVIIIHGDIIGLYNCVSNSIRIDSEAIEELDCLSCGIKRLELDNCPSLKRLFLGENHLIRLDLTHCPELEELECWENWELKELDLSNNPELRILSAGMNHPELKIDVSKNPLLESFDSDANATEYKNIV